MAGHDTGQRHYPGMASDRDLKGIALRLAALEGRITRIERHLGLPEMPDPRDTNAARLRQELE